jgi:NADP-dependent 3-hydroxy acid dehydrogenase YdfG
MAKDIDLTGKIAVVTGAGSGIGAATARPRLIVVSPPSQVLPLYLLQRFSPRLAQPLARIMTKIVTRG